MSYFWKKRTNYRTISRGKCSRYSSASAFKPAEVDILLRSNLEIMRFVLQRTQLEHHVLQRDFTGEFIGAFILIHG